MNEGHVVCDSVHSEDLEAFHEGDTYNPLDPAGIEERLAAHGFVDIVVRSHDQGWAATAVRAG